MLHSKRPENFEAMEKKTFSVKDFFYFRFCRTKCLLQLLKSDPIPQKEPQTICKIISTSMFQSHFIYGL